MLGPYWKNCNMSLTYYVLLFEFKLDPHNTKEIEAATKIFKSGMYFLRCYSKLATTAIDLGRPLWVYKPKIHYFHHCLLDIKVVLDRGAKPLNALAYSCAMAEDFIGRASFLSRRVSSRTTQLRVLQRYLAGAFDVWKRHQLVEQD